jgi:hypothetical protein
MLQPMMEKKDFRRNSFYWFEIGRKNQKEMKRINQKLFIHYKKAKRN